jgi:sec-independent protein translocase protein TatB
MFNIGSFEVLLICIIALVVLGPERLPGAIRTTGLWIGRFRRSFYKVKSEIERELNADEIRRQLHNESILADLEKTKSDVKKIAKDTEDSMGKIVNSKDFDPGASQATSQQGEESVEKEKTIKEEIKEVGEQIEEVAQELYGSGKNPKLAGSNESASDEKSTDRSDAESGKA